MTAASDTVGEKTHNHPLVGDGHTGNINHIPILTSYLYSFWWRFGIITQLSLSKMSSDQKKPQSEQYI